MENGLYHTDYTPRGRLRKDAALAGRCWLGVGGAADWLFTPQDSDDLSDFLQAIRKDVAVTVLGVGSNILVRDGGIEGVVIRLGREFATVTYDDTTVSAGAAALDVNVAKLAAQNGLAGLEFLVGIPGTIGGAVRMNAGAYASDMAAVTQTIEAVDRKGKKHLIYAKDAGFSYRHSTIADDWIVTRTTLHTSKDNSADIWQRMQEIITARETSQPVRSKTGGSTFKNPSGYKAWELIDAAGARGLSRGDAQISPLHCNFLINHGNATADDLESLGEEVRERVMRHSGVGLEWEIKRIGRRRAA